jgi:ABC-type branched-subunit amino acid transport system ATPase component
MTPLRTSSFRSPLPLQAPVGAAPAVGRIALLQHACARSFHLILTTSHPRQPLPTSPHAPVTVRTVEIEDWADTPAADIPTRQALHRIARALARAPAAPSGRARADSTRLKRQLITSLYRIRDRVLTIVIVEHYMGSSCA